MDGYSEEQISDEVKKRASFIHCACHIDQWNPNWTAPRDPCKSCDVIPEIIAAKEVDIEGIFVPVLSASFTDHNILGVHIGTNCPQGGDAGHGGRTLFRLDNVGGALGVDVHTASPPHVFDGRYTFELGEVDAVSIALGGDAEAQTFADALEFAVAVLDQQLKRRE